MRKLLPILLLCIYNINTHAEVRIDSILQVLNREIEKKEFYTIPKEETILSIRSRLNKNAPVKEQYDILRDLYKNYISYNYDSAYYYAKEANAIASKIPEPLFLFKTQCDLAYCYLSVGLFKEAFDLANKIDIDNIDDAEKGRYYNLYMRMYNDMCNYSIDLPSYEEYYNKTLLYCDSALLQLEPKTIDYDFLYAYKAFCRQDLSNNHKIDLYEKLAINYPAYFVTDPAACSILGQLYYFNQKYQQAIYYLALSSILDIRNATRENTAMYLLANVLLDYGEIEAASKYINVALEDANVYNARHRQVKINSILPVIESERITLIKSQKKQLAIYLGVVCLLVSFLVIALFIIYKQNRKLKQAKKSIDSQLKRVSEMNEELKISHKQKDEQIFNSLYAKSAYLDKVETILKKLDRKIKAKQFNEISNLRGEFGIKSERDEIYEAFDRAFLKQFPTFVERYNALLLPGEHIDLDERGNMPPELRIFALIRLGMNDNESISRFLNLSVNTIYSYKTRAKNRIRVPKEDFENHIMQIQKNVH